MVNLPTDILRSFDADAWGRQAEGLIDDLKTRIDDGLQQATAAIPRPEPPRLPTFELPSLESFGAFGDPAQDSQPEPFRLPPIESFGFDGAPDVPAPFQLPDFASFSREWTEPSAQPSGPGRFSLGTPPAGTGSPSPASPAVEADTSSPDAFLASVTPAARAAARAAGLPDWAGDIAAGVAGNETGYGRAVAGNNYFGIKGSNPRTGANTGPVNTWEVENGQRVNIQDTFRAYATPGESFDDFFAFLRDNPRYGAALQAKDPASFIKAIHAAGYATDPAWSDKVLSIAGQASGVQGAPPVSTALRTTPASTQGALDVGGLKAAYSGVPYVFGGAGGRSAGLGAPTDCSGFTSAWAKSQGIDLPAHTDAAYNKILNETGRQVSSAEARPGDLVFYLGAGSGGAVTHHMGIFAGPGRVLDMSTANGGGVQERPIGHAGQYVILRDERLSGGGRDPNELVSAPPIVASGVAEQTGGDPAAAERLGVSIFPDKGEGLRRAFAYEPAGDSERGPFDPPGYEQDSTFGNFDPPGYGDSPPPTRDNYASERPPDTRGLPGQISDFAGRVARGEVGNDIREGLSTLPQRAGDAYSAAINKGLTEPQLIFDNPQQEQEEMARYRAGWDSLAAFERAAILATPGGAALDPTVGENLTYLRRLLLAQPQAIADVINQALPDVARRDRLGIDTPLGRLGIADVIQIPGRTGRAIGAVQSLGVGQAGRLPTGQLQGFGVTEVPGRVGEVIQRGADTIGQGEPVRRAGQVLGTLRDASQELLQGRAGGAPVARAVGDANLGGMSDDIVPGRRLPSDYVYHNTRAEALSGIEQSGMDAGSFSDRPIDFGGDVWVAVRKSDLPGSDNPSTFTHDYGGVPAHEPRYETGLNPDGSPILQAVPPEKIVLVDQRGRVIRRLSETPPDPALAAEADRLSGGRQAGRVPGQSVVAQESDRYYHGTGSAFDTPNPATFDENGLFGPGYYLTSDPRVAGSYGEARAPQAARLARYTDELVEFRRILDDPQSTDYQRYLARQNIPQLEQLVADVEKNFTAAGRSPNIRAVDVPRGLRLLDAEAVPDVAMVRAIGDAIPDQRARDLFNLHGFYQDDRTSTPLQTGKAVHDLVVRAAGLLPDEWTGGSVGSGTLVSHMVQASRIMARAGLDGITYSGGKRIPMTDADGSPIEHQATMIFPESLPKITNAISGRSGGLLPSASPIAGRLAGQATGGAVAGGYAASQEEGATPESIARGALAGAAGGLARGAIGRRGSGQALARAVGRAGEELPAERPTPIRQTMQGQPRQERAAELSRPIVLTDEEQIARIRLDKFPEELRDDLLRAARGTGFGERLRRGVLSDEAVQTVAAEYAPTVESAIASSRRGRAYSAEEIVGLRNLMVGQTERTKTLAAELAEGSMTRDERLAAQAQLAMEQKKLALLGDVVFGGMPAEAGRALRQFRQIAQSLEVDPAAAGLRYLKQQFGSLDKAEEVTAKYLTMVHEGAGPIELAKFLKGAQGDWLNRLGIIRYASMLSSTTTHAINATGNALMQGVDLAVLPIAAGLDVARVAALSRAGRPAQREIFFSELPARLHGMTSGVGTGLQDAAFIMRHGLRPEDVTKLDHLRQGFGTDIPVVAPRGTARAEAVDFIVEGPLRALSAADAVFRSAAMGGHLASEATAKVLRGGGKTTPEAIFSAMADPKVIERADDLAKRSVLQEENFGRDLSRRIRDMSGPGRAALEALMPFVATPYSIVAQGVGMTPAGVVKAVMDARAGKGARNVEETLGRVALGTAVMGAAASQYLAGNLTGPRPEDEAERSTLPPGWQPWSVKAKLPNGETRYFPMAGLGPLAVPMVVSILSVEAQKQGKTPNPAETAVGIAQFASDQTFLRGVGDFSKALSNGKIENFVEGLATQYVPHVIGGGALGRQIQAVTGQPQRDPQGAIQAILATLPYGATVAENTPAGPIPLRRDVLGRPQRTAPGGIESAVSPFRATLERDAPVIAAYRRAGEGLPSAAPKRVRDPDSDQVVALSQPQQDRWRVAFGSELQRLWQEGDRPQDVEALRKIEQQARDEATLMVLGR